MTFDIVVPLWNEGCNVARLVDAIDKAGLHGHGMKELVLVNNGSSDDTAIELSRAEQQHSWVRAIHLPVNLNYGGGVYEGFRHTSSDVVCYIPGDLQVLPGDVLAVLRAFKLRCGSDQRLLVKGRRVIRYDPWHTRCVSVIYTFMANCVLGLSVADVNGLPKMFHRILLDELPANRMTSFVFDAQLIATARTCGWQVDEVPVTFHGRRDGVSSWSGKRIRTYWQVLLQLFAVRRARLRSGVALSARDRDSD